MNWDIFFPKKMYKSLNSVSINTSYGVKLSLPLALVAVPGRAGKSSLCIWNPGTLSTGFDSCPATEATKEVQTSYTF